MKKIIILICISLCFCICLASCVKKPETPENTAVLENKGLNISPTSDDKIHIETPTTPSQKPLLVSDKSYTLPSQDDDESGYTSPDLRIFPEEMSNVGIAFMVIEEDELIDYLNVLYEQATNEQERLKSPSLYLTLHHFNVSLEDVLEASNSGNKRYAVKYDENDNLVKRYDDDFLRALYLPYEEMIEATLFNGAYINGELYNIQSLNELFENDKEAFAQIELADLVEYQKRLEKNGVDYGFNEDMVKFANENCRRSGS